MTEEIKEGGKAKDEAKPVDKAAAEAAQREAEEKEKEMVREIIRSKKIAVLTGGTSPQREISLRSGDAVFQLLKEEGCNVVLIDVDKDVANKLLEEKPEVAFITLLGKRSSDGAIQGLLEIMGIPYTGSGVLASAQAAHKASAKQIFERNHLSTPAWEMVTQEAFRSGYVMMLDLPLVFKPVTGGGSMGVHICFKGYLQDETMEKTYQLDPEALIGERLVDGKLLSVGILDDTPLPVLEIESKNEFYDYNSKFEDMEKTTFFIPPKITAKKQKMIQDLALKAHKALRCKGATRVDVMLNQVGNPFLLEVNTTPGFMEYSPLVISAKAAGMEHRDLLFQIIELAIPKQVDEELQAMKERESQETQAANDSVL